MKTLFIPQEIIAHYFKNQNERAYREYLNSLAENAPEELSYHYERKALEDKATRALINLCSALKEEGCEDTEIRQQILIARVRLEGPKKVVSSMAKPGYLRIKETPTSDIVSVMKWDYKGEE